jgi:hypothetical protein
VSAVRSLELSRLVRSCAAVFGGMLCAILRLDNTGTTQIRDLFLGSIDRSIHTLLLLLIGRSIYRALLDAHRRQGKFVRDVLINSVRTVP